METQNAHDLTFKIEHGIPLPPLTRKSKWREQFEAMSDSDSILVPTKTLATCLQAASRYKVKVASRADSEKPGYHRVWKMAA